MRKKRTRNTIHYNLDDVANLLGVCKQTIYNYMKQYYAANREELSQYLKQYHADHREERNQYSKQYITIKRANDLCAIYAILIAGFKYIGSTHTYEHRKIEHLSDLRLGKHSNKALQSLYNDHGPDALEFVVLAELPKSTLKHDRLLLEQHFINQTPSDSCLNLHSAYSNKKRFS